MVGADCVASRNKLTLVYNLLFIYFKNENCPHMCVVYMNNECHNQEVSLRTARHCGAVYYESNYTTSILTSRQEDEAEDEEVSELGITPSQHVEMLTRRHRRYTLPGEDTWLQRVEWILTASRFTVVSSVSGGAADDAMLIENFPNKKLY